MRVKGGRIKKNKQKMVVESRYFSMHNSPVDFLSYSTVRLKLKYVPCLGKYLCHLKSLKLAMLPELEYMIIEEESSELASTSSAQNVRLFYPSLQELTLTGLPKWKGWRKGGVELEETISNNNSNSTDSIITPLVIMNLCLPQLKKLEIDGCGEFTNTLLCPMLETLTLRDFNDGMLIEWTNSTDDEKSREEAAIQNTVGITHNVPNLRDLSVNNGAWLDSISMESLQRLQTLSINGDDEMVELPYNLQYSSALHTLKIIWCKNLKVIPLSRNLVFGSVQ